MASSISHSGNVRGYNISSAAIFENIGTAKRSKKKKGRQSNGTYPSGMRREYMFDMGYLEFALRMLYQIPGAQFARRAMQARAFCHEFLVEFTNWPGEAGGDESRTFSEDTQDMVRRHWMPFLKEMYDYKEAWGFCPYVWDNIEGTSHWYPRVPPWDTYILSYEEDRSGREYRLYWTDDIRPEEATEVFWVRSDQEPVKGQLRTAIASLMPEYDLYLVNMTGTKTAIVNRSNPYHIFEHHPKPSGDLDEIHDTRLMFGEASALSQHAMASMKQREGLKQAQEGVSREYLVRALHSAHEANYGNGWPAGKGPTSVDEQNLQETHGQFLQRTVMLSADHVYKAAQTSDVVLKMEDIWRKLNQDAANALGFPLEFAQAQSAQRAANVQGNTRYINENVKQLIREYTRILKRMWLVSPYGRIIQKLNDLKTKAASEQETLKQQQPPKKKKPAKKGKKSKKRKKPEKDDDDDDDELQKGSNIPRVRMVREPSLRKEYELRKLIDVKVKFSCAPEMSYEQLRELVLDNVIDHAQFIKLSSDIYGLPEGSVSTATDGRLMEQEQMEIAKKDAREKWKHQDEALKWHEMRAHMAGAQEGGGGQVQLPPTASGSAVPPPSRANRPADSRPTHHGGK